jgi:ribosomal protein L11 methyltransferase
MRQYIEISIACADEEMGDIVTAFLADYPFETFDYETTETSYLVKAYILKEAWEECNEEALVTIEEYGSVVSQREMEDENWNETWERESFAPIAIDDSFLIRAAHHDPAEGDVRDIIIAPRMSFGSGHHQTTRMMCRLIRELCSGGRVLDVGCGTGVLSIAAVHCGAEHVDAVDIDPWSVDSAQEAAALNDMTSHMEIILGTVEAVEGRTYDMIVANINRNIILADLDRYLAALNTPSKLLLSGFLQEDIADIREACQVRGLRYVTHREEDGWIAMAMER